MADSTKAKRVLAFAADKPPRAASGLPEAGAHEWGFLDELNAGVISGWAWNPADPDETRIVEIIDGEDVLVTLQANEFRPDLQKAGIGTARYGFSVQNVGSLLSCSRHLLRVRCARTKVDLPGSPKLLVRGDVGLDGKASDFMDGVLSDLAAHAKDAGALDEALSFLLAKMNDLVNARFRLKTHDERPVHEVASRTRLTDWTHDLVSSLLHHYQPVRIEPAAKPVVSVIIPVHEKFSVTYDCIASIQNHPPACPIEIIIVDDGSQDETLFAGLLFSGAIRVVRTPRNGGFIDACNFGAAQAVGDYLFFLNNDTLVRENWLDTLVETFANVPNVGIAGSRLIFPDGSLQEVGGIIWKLGDGWNWGRNGDAAAPQFNFLRDADYVSGAALMIPRPLFEELRGFDVLYRPAYYEDTDLCFRVHAMGKRVVVQPASTIVHLEGVSNGVDTAGTGLKRYQVVNHRKFYMRWRERLTKHRANAERPELEAERDVRKRAYFIDDSALTPEQDAGSNGALQHILALQELGYKITFIPADNMARLDPHTRAMEKIGVECVYAPYFWSVEEVLRKATVAPDLVYLHRYSNASKYAALIREKFPKCRIVYNLCDLHFLREEREAELTDDDTLRKQAAAKRWRELTLMQQVDSVIVYSQFEAEMLRKLVPDVPIEVVCWAVTPRPTAVPFEQRSGYAFVGGFRHPPNLDAVLHFASSIQPMLPPTLDDRLLVIGAHMPDRIAQLHGQKIDVRGHVPVLADALHQVRCTIAPLRYGAGVKGKVLESFAHGLPCVMTPIAAEGLPIKGDLTWLIANTDEEFAQKLEALLTDPEQNQKMTAAGQKMMQQYFSRAAMLGEIKKVLA